MQAIGTLLNEQAAWATAGGSQVTGSIEGNVVTIKNSGAAIQLPLTGMTDVGTPYAGTVSGWTNAPSGTSTHTALAAWPALPTTPVVVTVPTGPAPGADTGATVTNKAPTPIIPPGGSTTPHTKVVTKADRLRRGAGQAEDRVDQARQGDRLAAVPGDQGQDREEQALRGLVHAQGRRPQAGPPVPVQVLQDPPVHGQAADRGDVRGHAGQTPSPSPDGGLLADLNHPDARQGTG